MEARTRLSTRGHGRAQPGEQSAHRAFTFGLSVLGPDRKTEALGGEGLTEVTLGARDIAGTRSGPPDTSQVGVFPGQLNVAWERVLLCFRVYSPW